MEKCNFRKYSKPFETSKNAKCSLYPPIFSHSDLLGIVAVSLSSPFSSYFPSSTLVNKCFRCQKCLAVTYFRSCSKWFFFHSFSFIRFVIESKDELFTQSALFPATHQRANKLKRMRLNWAWYEFSNISMNQPAFFGSLSPYFDVNEIFMREGIKTEERNTVAVFYSHAYSMRQ